ncbi:hypothetical protein FNV43_RR10273 [Rhamnella rubrinervis]|uniref:Uncharacterized protein n=1 Tax=Rhamnella rubrinervis TaxID=2594499 RepID=A0A8K0HCB7_9ROSA|nr:hypothetical protein FNV43_RR10273 [Rhamnella rubrinervis]
MVVVLRKWASVNGMSSEGGPLVDLEMSKDGLAESYPVKMVIQSCLSILREVVLQRCCSALRFLPPKMV